MKLKKILLFFNITLLLANFNGCSIETRSEEKQKKDLLNYLEEKYSEDFVIEEFYKYQWEGIDKGPSFEHGKIYLENNKDLVFSARKQGKNYYDDYQAAKYALDLQDNFDKIINSNIKTDYNYKVTIDDFRGLGYNARPVKPYTSEEINMSGDDYLEQTKDKIYMKLTLAIQVDNEEDIKKYYEGIYNILKYIDSFETKNYGLYVGFAKDVNAESIKQGIRLYENFGFSNDDTNKNMYGYLLLSMKDDISNIDEIHDHYHNYY